MPRFDLARGVVLAAGAVTAAASLYAHNSDSRLTADTMKSFAFRSVGPSLTSGRISDVARRSEESQCVVRRGGRRQPLEDGQPRQHMDRHLRRTGSLGAVTIDPKDSNIVWLGTGENNYQRSVSFGDGVSRSSDAGATWKRMGLSRPTPTIPKPSGRCRPTSAEPGRGKDLVAGGHVGRARRSSRHRVRSADKDHVLLADDGGLYETFTPLSGGPSFQVVALPK